VEIVSFQEKARLWMLTFGEFVADVFKGSRLKNVYDTRSFEVAEVDSTAISEISYNRGSSIMMITFQSGATYNYFGCPESQFEDLVGASSIGATFVREVRNDYIYFKIG
jgi:hypothetical protein